MSIEHIRKRKNEDEDEEMMFIIFPALHFYLSRSKREKRHHDFLYGKEHVRELLSGHLKNCLTAFRMEPHIFMWLASYLRNQGLISDSRIKVEEKLAFFLYMLSHNASYEDLQIEFHHSGQIFSKYINQFFDIVPILSTTFLKPLNLDEPHPKITTDPRFFPYFQNCIGAIDGSHVPVTRKPSRAAPWRNRKGSLSQNVMFACDFDLNITYISSGWEGSATDARVLSSAILRGFKVPDDMYPKMSPKFGQLSKMGKKRPSPKRTKRPSPKITKKPSPKAPKKRAQWNARLEKSLVEILHEHDNTYHRGQNGWSRETWNAMVDLFHERNPHVSFDKSQVQDKEKELKRDYRMLKDARQQSGVGWLESEFKLQAESHLWDNLETSFGTRIKRFMVKAFPLYDSLGELYHKHTAEGSYNFTSTAEQYLKPEVIESDEHDDVENAQINQQKEPGPSTSKTKKQKKSPKKSSGDGLVCVIDRFVKIKEKQAEDERAETKEVNMFTISKCIEVVHTMAEISKQEKIKAFKVFIKAENRETFLTSAAIDQETAILWLQQEIAELP